MRRFCAIPLSIRRSGDTLRRHEGAALFFFTHVVASLASDWESD